MPRKSYRTRLEEEYAVTALTGAALLLDDAEEEDACGQATHADNSINTAHLLFDSIRTVQRSRYLRHRLPVVRAGPTIYERLMGHFTKPEPDYARFRQLVRVEPAAFQQIVDLLRSHPNFSSKRGGPASIEEQVAVGLYRMGHDGNGASAVNTAEIGHISEGSVVNYTRRTIQALCSLEESVLCWASETEKEESKAWVEDRCQVPEWRDGYASCDGVHIICAWAPGLDGGDSFMNRKRRFSFNVQLVTLVHTLRIINYVVGHRGASADARVWAASSVSQSPARFLRNDEWLWADLGYPYATYLVSPYRHMAATKSRDLRRFNYHLSNIRVRSEHAMAYLKGRFPSFKGYRGLLSTKEAEQYAQDFIVAALVVHNLAMAHEDASKFALYVKAGLDRVLTDGEMDWEHAVEKEMQARAVEDRERSHRRWVEQQKEEIRTMTARDRNEVRIDAAKERREALHHALNEAKGYRFVDTTWRSRQKELTSRQLRDVEDRRLRV